MSETNKFKYFLFLVFFPGILCGVFIFFYGGYDDSPGAQFLGLLMVIGTTISLIRRKKKLKA